MDAPTLSFLDKTAYLPVAAHLTKAAYSQIQTLIIAFLFLTSWFAHSPGNAVHAGDTNTVTATISSPIEIVPVDGPVEDDWEELCGWVPLNKQDVGTYDLGTHDSVPGLVPIAAEPVSASDGPLPSPSQSDGTPPITTNIFATATQSLKVTVETIAEPFVALGPRIQSSLHEIKAYQQWWQETLNRSTADTALRTTDTGPTIAAEPTTDTGPIPSRNVSAKSSEREMMDVEIIVPANDDPCDAPIPTEPFEIATLGCSVLDETTVATVNLDCNAELGPPGIEVKPLRRRVGSTVVVASIEEAYMPYDIAAKDMRLWNLLPASTRPYSIRHGSQRGTPDAMWDRFDEQVVLEQEAIPKPTIPDIPVVEVRSRQVAFACASPYCVLDETLHTVRQWTSPNGRLTRSMQPRQIGRRLSGFVLRGHDLIERAADALALNWPPAKPVLEGEPSPAGRALLARAGASEREAPVAVARKPVLSCRR